MGGNFCSWVGGGARHAGKRANTGDPSSHSHHQTVFKKEKKENKCQASENEANNARLLLEPGLR